MDSMHSLFDKASKQRTDRFGAVQLSPTLNQPLIMPSPQPLTQEPLVFTVVSALSLRAASKGITSNPICEVSLVMRNGNGRRESQPDPQQGPSRLSQRMSQRSPSNIKTVKSEVVKSSMNPIWNLRVDFGLLDLEKVLGVRCVVRHVEKLGFINKELGQLWLPLHEVMEMVKLGGERIFHLQPPESSSSPKDSDEQSSYKKPGRIVLRMGEPSEKRSVNNPTAISSFSGSEPYEKRSVDNPTTSSSFSGSEKNRASIAHEDDFSASKPPAPAHDSLFELKQIRSFHQNSPRPGDIWYAIPSSWIDDWLLFVSKHHGKDEFNPGAIPNNNLLSNHSRDGTMRLRKDLQLKRDFRVINQPTWELYQQLYGGGPAIQVPVPKDCQDTRTWLKQIKLHQVGHVASSYI